MYHQLNRDRELRSLRKRAKLLGLELVDLSTGEVLMSPVFGEKKEGALRPESGGLPGAE